MVCSGFGVVSCGVLRYVVLCCGVVCGVGVSCGAGEGGHACGLQVALGSGYV